MQPIRLHEMSFFKWNHYVANTQQGNCDHIYLMCTTVSLLC